jgi:hypothetical protein
VGFDAEWFCGEQIKTAVETILIRVITLSPTNSGSSPSNHTPATSTTLAISADRYNFSHGDKARCCIGFARVTVLDSGR